MLSQSRREVRMSGQLQKAINKGEARAIQHLGQARFGRIKSDIAKALVLAMSFIAQIKNRVAIIHTHTLNDQQLPRDVPQLANDPKRIFQVIEQAQSEHKVKRANSRARNLLGFTNVNLQPSHATPCFFRVLRAAFECIYAKAELMKQ